MSSPARSPAIASIAGPGMARELAARLALVAVLGAAVLGASFGSRLLLNNDDARFPVMARDVLVNGHWLVPAMPDGTPHVVKPPMVVWLIALASWPAGSVSVQSAVLPSLLEAVAVALLTCWLGARLFGPDAGVVAGLCVATTIGVYSMAQSSMPDMAQLAAAVGAIAVYVASGFGDRRRGLITFYAVVGVGSLAKGVPGLIPLAIVVVDTATTHGMGGLRRLVSIPGWIALAALAGPWWIAATAVGGRSRMIHGFVMNDQVLFYFWRPEWNAQVVTEPLVHALTVVLPWGALLPFAMHRALREADPEERRRVRLALVWLVTAFVLVALSARQRERYYLPLCPAAALLVGWWYRTLAWRWRGRGFAAAWIAVVAAGVALVPMETARYNATTDLREVGAVLARAPAPVFSVDLQDLALSFNLGRPVVNDKDYKRFEARARTGEDAYLIISDRALRQERVDPCMQDVATGRVTRQPFTVLGGRGCGEEGPSPPGGGRSG